MRLVIHFSFIYVRCIVYATMETESVYAMCSADFFDVKSFGGHVSYRNVYKKL